jgi:tRNA A37 threonylcarbamoyladenosine biosynthesis protein TsaE
VQLYHLDLYRLGPQDLPDLGIEDILGAQAVVAVEWSERLPPSLSGDALEVELSFVEGEDESRRFTLRARGPHGEKLLKAVLEELRADARD